MLSTRSHPGDLSSVVYVESASMRTSKTAVLLRSIHVRCLPADVEELTCAITITVRGTSYTTSPIRAECDHDSICGQVNHSCASTGSISRGRTGVFKIHYEHLGLVFPGARLSYGESAKKVSNMTVENPRVLDGGVQIMVHSVDRNHLFGSCLCIAADEWVLLSYPRGEVRLDFRVYPCVEGEVMARPLYNRTSLVNTYLFPDGTTTTSTVAGDADNAALFPSSNALQGSPLKASEVRADAATSAAKLLCADVDTPEAVDVTEVMPSSDNSYPSERAIPSEGSSCCEAALPVDGEGQVTEESAGVMHNNQEVKCFTQDEFTDIIQSLIPCYMDDRIRAAFDLYDEHRNGTIGMTHLLHFCRSHVALFDETTSDSQILKSLSPYIVQRCRANETCNTDANVSDYMVCGSPEDPDHGAQGSLNDNQGVNREIFSLVALKLAHT